MNIKSKYQEFAHIDDSVLFKASKIELILMDVDGVLTNGQMSYLPGPDGSAVEFKGLNSHDGLGFHFLNRVGIKSGVISGRVSFSTSERARNLKMTYVIQDRLDKEDSFMEILNDAKLDSSQVCYVGDDFTDAPLIVKSGLGCAVADARPEVLAVSDYITAAKGGHGAVREVIELILKCRGLWDAVLDYYHLK